jgi:hypothetical protein
MPPEIIIPANVLVNLIENIQKYFEFNDDLEEHFMDSIEVLDAVQHTLHDVLMVSGGKSMYEDGIWMDNPYYINFRDQTTVEDSTAEDRASED